MKKMLKKKDGITLISLVVTIIILLILAGISIGMLSGDNGILGQAGNAKTQTDIAGEKEIIDLAVVHAMGKSKYGDIDETSFTNELEKNNATVTKTGSKYKVAFTSGRQYTVDSDGNVKEKKVNPNAMKISELNENASTFFGWDIINYAETLPTELQDTKWQLFYAGALDGETEERIYLISKEYVKNTLLPSVVKNGVKVTPEAKPIPIDGSEYQAKFGGSTSTGIMPQYAGSTDITTYNQKYNKKYFQNYSSLNNNMKAVAYMLDISTWSSFATSNMGYAEYSIGGPSIELLFTAYNKYKGLTGNNLYTTQVPREQGYQISVNGGINYANYYNEIIENDGINQLDNPYSVSSLSSLASGYWLSSPANGGQDSLFFVTKGGNINSNSYTTTYYGFRPLVLLDSNYSLEKTKDKDGYDAFKIVEQ